MAFPTTIPFNALNFRSITPTIINRSLSGIENRTQVAGQYWTFTARFSTLTEEKRKELLGYLMSLRGNLNTDTIALPEPLNDSSGNYTGNITNVSGSAGALSCTASVTSNSTLILKAGDIIKFGNHNKVYMVTSNATSNGSGAVTINFFPALRTAVSSGTCTHKDVTMTVRVVNPEISFQMGAAMFADFDLDFEEVLS